MSVEIVELRHRYCMVSSGVRNWDCGEFVVMNFIEFLLLAQRRRYDPFQTLWSWLPLLIAAVVLVLLIWAILRILSKMNEDVDPAEADREMLQALRDLRREGDLSEDEFRSIRGKLATRLNTLQPGEKSSENVPPKSAESAAGQSPQPLASKGSTVTENTELKLPDKEESVQPE